MSAITFEILFILLLLLANGVFAMSELAIVSSRKARLQQKCATGNARACAALELALSPDRFLSTIQIGITLVGILAGALGGATIAEQLGEQISRMPALAPYGEAIGVAIVVVAITYLSLIIGELVPKRFALTQPERIAMLVAQPMKVLSKIVSPVVTVLSVSTSAVLTLLRIKHPTDPPVTEDEIKVLIEQGTAAGVFEEAEQEMVERVFKLADRRVSSLMTPRLDIVWLDVNESRNAIRQKVAENHYSRFPVCRDSMDQILGVVKAKDMLAHCLGSEELNLNSVLKVPLFVPESRSALQVLEVFKSSGTHMALIVNEYGSIEGLVTTNDVLEAIVGDILPANPQFESYAIQREDGSWLFDGALPIDEFKEIFKSGKLPGEERADYQTLAGFIFFYLGRIPQTTDHFEWNGLRFEIMDMDGNRIDKVLVTRAA
ncbi:MAG TPA: hemolysin family protein [Pyrinomonadaceae bacterium]|nr:hemolysin family protein [Pyrinomonadaceae bacterium]